MSSSPPPPPREVRVTDYARRVARRWYVVIAAVVIAVALVFLHKVSGSTNQATATASVYLGQPLAPGGGPIPQTPQSNSGIAVTFVKSTATLADAAKTSGLTAKRLHSHVSVIATSASAGGTAGSATRTSGGAPTVSITVEGPWSRQRVEAAATSLANSLIGFENRYADIKRRQLKARITAEQTEVKQLQATVDRANAALQEVDRSSLSSTEKVAASASWGQILATSTQQLGDVSTQLPNDQIALAAVDAIESAQIVSGAQGRQVSAVRRRSSFVVAAFIGFIVGVGLALLWEELRARRAVSAPA